MILDALTRAEHERQLESQPDLNFVTPVKQRKTKPNNIALLVGVGLLVNALVLTFFLWPQAEQSEIAIVQPAGELSPVQEKNAQEVVPTQIPKVAEAPAPVSSSVAQNKVVIDQQGIPTQMSSPERPLVMEASKQVTPEMDRPLIYEAKHTTNKPVTHTKKSSSGNVSFSATELDINGSDKVLTQAPKLLIDQGAQQPSRTQSLVPKLKDLPESSRLALNQYEINVHVFDDNPQRRFVLINMDKYKQGERIANNGPLVEEITKDGVIVDYGNGRALLPPK